MPNPAHVDTALGSLAIRRFGDGPRDLLLWPAIFTDGHIFDPVLPDLAAQAHITVIDGPGHGRSDGPNRRFTMADCAAALETVLDALGIERAVVGGVSWGGIVACELALAAPSRVAGLVAMNTPFATGIASPTLSTRAVILGARWMPGSGPFRRGVARSFFTGPGPERGFHDMLQGADRRHLGAAVRSVLAAREPLMPRLPGITAPALLIAGADDALYPPALAAEASLRLGDARLEIVPGRHVAPVEAPHETIAALGAFLEERT